MSFFDDQMDAWFENDCQGNPGDLDPFTGEVGAWVDTSEAAKKPRTEAQKARKRRNRARRRAKAALAQTKRKVN